jgi:hypothetical protein
MSALAPTFTGLAALDVVVAYLRDGVRAFGSRFAARPNATISAPHVDRSADRPDYLRVYLGTVSFVNGDAWEVFR